MVDLQFNYPILPGQDATFAKVICEVARDPEILKLPPYGGVAEHRSVAARWLSTAEHVIPPGRVLLSAGGHNAVMAAAYATGIAGKKIACDPLTYSGFIMQAKALGCPLVPCKGDEQGMLPDALDRAVREQHVAAAYLMPTIHNPIGTVMPLERRLAIVDVARKHGLFIIDDDAYRFLVADAPPHFAALAPDLGFSIYSFTKPFAPALKVAFFAFPERFANELIQGLRITSSGAPRVLCAVTMSLIKSGELRSIIAAKRKEGAMRQSFARGILSGLATRGYETSFHVMIDLPESLPSDQLARGLESEGILVSPSTSAVASREVRANGIRVALGAESDLDVLGGALRRVKKQIEIGLRILMT